MASICIPMLSGDEPCALPSSMAEPCKQTAGAPLPPAPAGIYVHVPFCRAKCPYCDFYSVTDTGRTTRYVEALLTEINRCRRMVPVVDTVYFGGGTPSLLAPHEIGRILETIRSAFAVTPDAEITLEVNPGTVDEVKLAAFQAVGINRLNIGLQSTRDASLRFLGRIHSARQVVDTVRWAMAAGFDNVGLDLIYGIPGQTQEFWEAELAEAVSLAPQHLSCYTLTIEPGTPLAVRVRQGHVQPLAEPIVGGLFTFTAAYLERNGYRRYEVSNFARHPDPQGIDRRSRHNRKYWTFAPYLGFGPAAHSFMGNRRWWNRRTLDAYLVAVEAGLSPVAAEESLNREQQIMEFIYLGLRQADGLDTDRFRSRFQADFADGFGTEVKRLSQEGLVHAAPKRVRLTDRGMAVLEHVVDRLLGCR